MEKTQSDSNVELVFTNLINQIKHTVEQFRLNIFLIISLISVFGFGIAVYRSFFLFFNLPQLIINSYMFLNFLISSIFCIRFKIKGSLNLKIFRILCYGCSIPYLILFYSIPFLSFSKLVGFYDFFASSVPVMLICLVLGPKRGIVVGLFYYLFFFLYFFLNLDIFASFDNSFKFDTSQPVSAFLTTSINWFIAGFLFIFFSSQVIKKMKSNIPIAIQKIEDIEEQNRKDKKEKERLLAEVEVINNLKNSLYYAQYKSESLEKFSLDAHFKIGSSQYEEDIFTPYYDCLSFEDHYLYCMGRFTEHNIYSMASILMIQTTLNNSFAKSWEERADIIEILDRINSVLFFNNQYRMKLGSFSTFTLVHYDLKKEQISFLSLNEEIIFIPKNSKKKDWIKCEFPIEMRRYYLGMFSMLPDVEKFSFYTFPFSEGDSVLICDYLDDPIDFFQSIKKEKILFEKESSEKVVDSLLQQEGLQSSLFSYIKRV